MCVNAYDGNKVHTWMSTEVSEMVSKLVDFTYLRDVNNLLEKGVKSPSDPKYQQDTLVYTPYIWASYYLGFIIKKAPVHYSNFLKLFSSCFVSPSF